VCRYLLAAISSPFVASPMIAWKRYSFENVSASTSEAVSRYGESAVSGSMRMVMVMFGERMSK